MKSDEILGIIELGNINIKCLIFKIQNNNNEILSTFITPSEGIHNDVVTNIAKASNVIRSCISNAEKKANISLKKINVVFEQPDFLCTKFSKHKKVNGSKIQEDDIAFLLKEAKEQLTHNDNTQSIIHIFNYNYIVDGKIFPEKPIGVYADTLTHEITFITAPKNNLKNINQTFIDCDIEIERLISRTFSLGVQLLSKNELKFGSVVVDIGFEKISFGLFKNYALMHSITFPIGINHISKDLSKVCSLNIDESNSIINNIDFSLKDNQKIFDENDFLKETYFKNSNYRKISKDLVLNIIKARLDEMFDKLKKQLIATGFNPTSGIGFFLTGGGSKLFNIEKYFSKFFGDNIKAINNGNIEMEKNFSSCLGAIKIITEGCETEAIPEQGKKNIEKMGFFEKIFKIH